MTVTDVHCSCLSFCISSMFRLSGARRDDDIISGEIETSESEWTEYTSEFMSAIQIGDVLEPRSEYLSLLEHRMIQVVYTRIDVCLRIELEEVREHEFRPSEINEPVGNYGYFLIFHAVSISKFQYSTNRLKI